MKRLIVGAIAVIFSTLQAVAGEQTVTFAVDRMTCVLCPITVKKAMAGVGGVIEVTVKLDTKQAIVRYDDAATTSEEIGEASTNAGYPATKVN